MFVAVASIAHFVTSLALLTTCSAASPEDYPSVVSAPSAVEVLQYELKTIKAQNAALEGDKEDLLKTIKRMLWSNQTQILEHQMRNVVQLKASVEERCAHERAQGQAQITKAEQKAEAASTDAREAVQKAEVAASNARLAVRLAQQESAKLMAQLKDAQQELEQTRNEKEHLTQSIHELLRRTGEHAHKRCRKHRRKRKRKQDEAVAATMLVGALRGVVHPDAQQLSSDNAAAAGNTELSRQLKSHRGQDGEYRQETDGMSRQQKRKQEEAAAEKMLASELSRLTQPGRQLRSHRKASARPLAEHEPSSTSDPLLSWLRSKSTEEERDSSSGIGKDSYVDPRV